MSAGNDKHLNIWKTSGELVDLIERNEQENLNCLLMISNKRVVTAGNSAEMVVYSLAEKRCVSLLVAHREPVRCLINLNASMFVSASIDGQIVVWSSMTLTALHEFNFHKTYINTDHVYIYNVHQLVKLSDQYLAACIGNGYSVYKIAEKSAECVMECLNAHSATVLAIAPLYYGTALVTSSADTSIRLWGSKIEFQFRPPPMRQPPPPTGTTHPSGSQTPQKGPSSTPKGKPSKNDPNAGDPSKAVDPRFDIKYVPPEKTVERNSVSSFLTSTLLDSDKPSVGIYPPRLIGDVCCHSDQVNIILPLSPFSFASASSDGGIVIWRDGRVQSAIRGELSIMSLRQWHTKHTEMSILEATTSHYASSEAKYSLSGSSSSLPQHHQQQHQGQLRQQQLLHSGAMARSPSTDFVVFDSPSNNTSPTSTTTNIPHTAATPSPSSTHSTISPVLSVDSLATLLSPPGSNPPIPPLQQQQQQQQQRQQYGGSSLASPRSPREHQRATSAGSTGSSSTPGSAKFFHTASSSNIPTASTLLPPANQPGVYVPKVHVRVPPYIADNAYYLFYELNYSLEQVQQALLADGNSEAIVVAALAELQQ